MASSKQHRAPSAHPRLGPILALSRWLVCWLLVTTGAAHAHLMVAQRGTLRVDAKGAWLVVSVPVAALGAVDDDADGKLSAAELRRHRGAIEARVHGGLRVLDDAGPCPLEGLLVNLAADHGSRLAPTDQVIAMGRYRLRDFEGALRVEADLFGRTAETGTLYLSATRGAAARTLVLSAEHPGGDLFPGARAVFGERLVQGAEHIFGGLDHLLFLLVVLAAASGLREVLGLLTAFTLGHGAVLVGCVLFHIEVPAAVVEPAIAATIVGMAAYDARRRWRLRTSSATPGPRRWLGRLVVVTGCAVIHGLGLASALEALGDDQTHLVAGLAGFNLGIEAAQVAVVAVAAASVWSLRRLAGAPKVQHLQLATAALAMVAGSAWLVERLVAA